MAALEQGGEIWFGGGRAATPCRKSFLADVKGGLTPVTIWPCAEVGHTHEANGEVKAALGQGVFDNPKPTRLIRRILELATRPGREDLVLDFFAGSGTTGAAVLAQNAADGGNRRYLLVQIPEPLDPGCRGPAGGGGVLRPPGTAAAPVGAHQGAAAAGRGRRRRPGLPGLPVGAGPRWPVSHPGAGKAGEPRVTSYRAVSPGPPGPGRPAAPAPPRRPAAACPRRRPPRNRRRWRIRTG